MAKKKFGLSSTLNKNKAEEPTLPQKVPLTRSSKNLEAVKEKVEALHDEKAPVVENKVAEVVEVPVKVEVVPETPKPAKKVTPKKKTEKKPERMVRITVDTPKSMHVKLKIKAIEEDITIRDYVIGLIKKDLGLK